MVSVFNGLKVSSSFPQNSKPLTVNDAIASSNVNNMQNDSFEISNNISRDSSGSFISKIKDNEYTKGILDASRDSIISGSVVYTGGSIINHFREKGAQKNLAQEGKASFTRFPSKTLAFATAVIFALPNLWSISLKQKLDVANPFK